MKSKNKVVKLFNVHVQVDGKSLTHCNLSAYAAKSFCTLQKLNNPQAVVTKTPVDQQKAAE
jgi:hypothetical protein